MLNTQRDMSSPSGQLSNPKDQNSIGKPVLFKLQAGIGQILLPLFVRGCTLLIMIGALVFGSKLQIFPLKETSVWGIRLDPDLQLVLIEVVNKILDYLSQNALEHLALMILTISMAQEPASSHLAGVHISDYDMKEELMKPWVAVANFIKRWRSFGWRGPQRHLQYSALLRFLATLTVSICFLLLGAGLNTVGIPKARWYPNLWPKTKANDALMTLRTPQMKLQNVDWMNYWDLGWEMVGGGPHSWEVAVALASASTFSALSSLGYLYQQQPPSWLGQDDGSVSGTIIDTRIDGSTAQSISTQGSFIWDIFHTSQKTGPSYARMSSGMVGSLNITLPMLTTSCTSDVKTPISDDTIFIETLEPLTSNATLVFHIGANRRESFNGGSCTLRLQQVISWINFWIGGKSPNTDLNLSKNSGIDSRLSMNSSIVLPSSSADATVLDQLRAQFSSMLPYLNGLVPGSSFVQHLVLSAKHLRSLRPDFETEIDSLTPVVAFTMQHLLTKARWNMTPSATETVTSYPVRWYVYGSGPRLTWEWAAGIILSSLILMLFYDVYLTLHYRVNPGPWLNVRGMMFVANTAERMESAAGSSAGVATQKSRKARYFVRDVENGRMEVTDEADKGNLVDKTQRYGEAQDRFVDSLRDRKSVV